MKKIIIAITTLALSLVPLVGCEALEPSPTVQIGEEVVEREKIASTYEAYTLIQIYKHDYAEGTLVYDQNTKIVYYYFSQTLSQNNSRAYMCPYYSENGNLCRFNVETEKIEEIN